MEPLIEALGPTPDSDSGPSDEARVVFNLARDADQLVWTLASLVAGLRAHLSVELVVSVMSIAFSVRYDPRCILPVKWTPQCANMNDNSPSDIPIQIHQYFAAGAPTTSLKRPRYELDSILGQRLAERCCYLVSIRTKVRSADTDGAQTKPGLFFRSYPGRSNSGLIRTDVTKAALKSKIRL